MRRLTFAISAAGLDVMPDIAITNVAGPVEPRGENAESGLLENVGIDFFADGTVEHSRHVLEITEEIPRRKHGVFGKHLRKPRKPCEAHIDEPPLQGTHLLALGIQGAAEVLIHLEIAAGDFLQRLRHV